MSATSLPQRHPPADRGYLIKILAGVLLTTAMVAILAQLGWAILPVAVGILIAISAAVLHATLGLLNETDEHADELEPR